MAGKAKAANERAEAYRVHIEWALGQPGLDGRRISFNHAAEKLNERNIETARGAVWTGSQVHLMAKRLGLYHPLSFVKRDLARARVRAVWKKHPEFTVRQVAAQANIERPLGITRTEKMLRECRQAAADRDPVHRQVGWHLDGHTAARIRIGAIWKRHPEFTGKQVMKRLGPRYRVRLHWVQQITRECWRAYAQADPKLARVGRRGRQLVPQAERRCARRCAVAST